MTDSIRTRSTRPCPRLPAQLAALGGAYTPNATHTAWVYGIMPYTGLTTVFTPNTFVPSFEGGQQVDISSTSCRPGTSVLDLTYAAITSRSHHPGVVNALLMDGSVRSVKNSINPLAWRTSRRGRPAKWSPPMRTDRFARPVRL